MSAEILPLHDMRLFRELLRIGIPAVIEHDSLAPMLRGEPVFVDTIMVSGHAVQLIHTAEPIEAA